MSNKVMNLVTIFFKLIGIDKAILLTSSSSIISITGSLFSAFLVLKKLTTVEQGFYYTFSSLVAIQIFFELGFNNIITQFTAHEVANLNIKSDGKIEGDNEKKSRLSYLLQFSVKLYLFLSFLLCVTLIIVGLYFFAKNNLTSTNIVWKSPWILLAISVTINFIISPLFAFIQGLGMVAKVAKIRLLQQILVMTTTWALFIFNFKLYILGIANLVGVSFLIISFYKEKIHLIFINLYSIVITSKISYFEEIFPYQWKIAISWISGYFIFQLFNPILFATSGPVVAGQMGMTLAALNGIQSISASWMSTKIPKFSNLIAQKKYEELDIIFSKALYQSISITIFFILTFIAILLGLDKFNIKISDKKISDRFISYLPLIFMCASLVLNQIVGAWGTYLRSHKKEPYLYTSLFGAIFVSLSTYFLGSKFGLIGLTIGYFTVTIVFLPITYYIYIKCKQIWHINNSSPT
jgi:O-antigen/teichoic acid export membrane protein